MADVSSNLAVPERAVAVAAHPDDNDFGCAGTAAKWADAGCDVTYIVATDGSKGTWSREQPPAELVPLPQKEQRDAANLLGVRDVVFLGYVDGELDNTL